MKWLGVSIPAQSGTRNHGLTLRTGADVLDLDSHKLLNVLHVIAGLFGQIVVGLRVGSRCLPAGHLVVDYLGSF